MKKEPKKYQKVFVVLFQGEHPADTEPALETIFSCRELASKYVRIERIKRELQAGELWYEQRSVIDSDFEL